MALVGLGFIIGALGTLVGVGGGFLLVPLLFYFYPQMSAEDVTAISLFCVTLNALSGSVQYGLQKRIQFKTGVLFALASWPGAALGVMATRAVERNNFEIIYAVLLLLLSGYLLRRGRPQEGSGAKPAVSSRMLGVGSGISIFVGFIAGFFGVGGGIVHVPVLHRAMKFPIHYATATSTFILALTSLGAVLYHALSGNWVFRQEFVFQLALGMVVGAQFGGWISLRVRSEVLVRILAFTILLVAIRLLYANA